MRTHEPTAEPTWQESNECHAFDPVAGTGFVTATGVFVNDGTGLAYVAAVAPDRDGKPRCFQRTNNDVAIAPEDRGPVRNGVSTLHWEWLDDTRGRLLVDDPDCEIDIVFEDFYPETHWAEETVPGAAGHVETSGRVSGRMRIGGIDSDLSCLGHRDQSWGGRDNRVVRSHAWLAGTCGPELSFSVENLVVARDGHAMAVRGGYVVENGVMDHIVDPDLTFEFAWDLFTPTSVHGVLRTASGREYTIESTGAASPLFFNGRSWRDEPGTLAATDRLFEVLCDGRRGIADLNLLPNVTSGREMPALLAGNPLREGLWDPED